MISRNQIPGRIIPAENSAMISFDGSARTIVNRYFVLCGRADVYKWISTDGGQPGFPPNAVHGGWMDDQTPIFIGRVKIEGAHYIGKVFIMCLIDAM